MRARKSSEELGVRSEEVVIRERRKLSLRSARELGLPDEHIHFLDFTDGAIADRPQPETERLQRLIADIAPTAIFVPHSGEGWPDHLAAREIILNLQHCHDCHNRESRKQKFSTIIYEYAVWMWYYNVWRLDWRNAFRFRMSKSELSAKRQAVDAYVKPLAPNGKPWSGVLPRPFLYANTRPLELYFRHEDIDRS